MNIDLTGHNLEITDALREFTHSKFDRLTKNFTNITNIHVKFDIENLDQIAEATINIPNHQIHARAESEDLYAAIDALVNKLNKQIIKHKEKDSNH